MRIEQLDHALGLGKRANEGNHDLDICQAHVVSHVAKRLALHRKTVSKIGGQIACGPAVTDHRILFVWFIAVTTEQAGVLIGLEVRHPYDHRVRRECAGDRGDSLTHSTYEEIARCWV